jgi:NAD(P)-dependent dehydrogenase (short-subunit alcohol dehydrogenase family)
MPERDAYDADHTVDCLGRLDVLINNAAYVSMFAAHATMADPGFLRQANLWGAVSIHLASLRCLNACATKRLLSGPMRTQRSAKRLVASFNEDAPRLPRC